MRLRELSLRQDPDLRQELASLARGCDFVLPSRFKKRLKAFQQVQVGRACRVCLVCGSPVALAEVGLGDWGRRGCWYPQGPHLRASLLEWIPSQNGSPPGTDGGGLPVLRGSPPVCVPPSTDGRGCCLYSWGTHLCASRLDGGAAANTFTVPTCVCPSRNRWGGDCLYSRDPHLCASFPVQMRGLLLVLLGSTPVWIRPRMDGGAAANIFMSPPACVPPGTGGGAAGTPRVPTCACPSHYGWGELLVLPGSPPVSILPRTDGGLLVFQSSTPVRIPPGMAVSWL